MLKFGTLHHGGIMANYRCTAACRHCLYACSPTRTNGYISEQMATSVAKQLLGAGCRSVHIGGGEPFMHFEGLLTLLAVLLKHKITVEYIETNAYWANDKTTVQSRLQALKQVGGNCLCISVDPYHAEYIPARRAVFLAEQCQQIGFDYFLWQQRFLPILQKAGLESAHNRGTLEQAVGKNYLVDTAQEYGITFGGRAINIEEEYETFKPISQLFLQRSCPNLLATNHFHVDCHGKYIPPSCTGIAFPLKEVVADIPPGKYPVLETLYHSGVAGLLKFAIQKGFTPKAEGYPSGCNLCFHLRSWLATHGNYAELDLEHYQESLQYYD